MPKKKLEECGTYHKISDNLWDVTMSYDGQRKNSKVTSEERAIETLEEFRNYFRKKAYAEKHKQSVDATLSEIVGLFLEYKTNKDVKPLRTTSSTRLSETFKNQILPYEFKSKKILGDLPFTNITSAIIQNNLRYLNEKGYSWSTIKKTQDAWQALFKYAVDNLRLIQREEDPMLRVEKYDEASCKKEVPELQIYTREEMELLEKELTKVSKDRLNKGNPSYNLGNLLMLGAYTGLRAGELCGLRKSDVDIDERKLSVEMQVVEGKATERDRKQFPERITEEGRIRKLGRPKTATGKREVPLTDKAIFYINKLKKQFPEGEMLAYSVTGDLASPAILAKHLKDACKRTGVRKIPNKGAHAMRDYFASICYDEGVELEVVSKWMGHTKLSTTWKYYIALGEKRQARAVEILNASDAFKTDLQTDSEI